MTGDWPTTVFHRRDDGKQRALPSFRKTASLTHGNGIVLHTCLPMANAGAEYLGLGADKAPTRGLVGVVGGRREAAGGCRRLHAESSRRRPLELYVHSVPVPGLVRLPDEGRGRV